jgi:UDP-N-acetylglucosamine 2-epimerase (non-hydrolysing)/GDP/UDP-N,N'-diacetylbacillosamine 2-epimerase (hydrolysing)
MKRKIAVTTGTRAEYGLLRPVLFEIKKSKKLDLKLIVAGMHLSKQYGSTVNEIKQDGFKISGNVEMVPQGNSNYDMALALSSGINQFSSILREIKPDINIILGDRDEPFASAIAAFHMNIPNAHIHGGDKSQAGIDEYIRHAITKISNIHFGASKKSTIRIKKLGEDPKYIFFTGSPGIDEIFQRKITPKPNLEKKYNLKFHGDEILLVQHPITTQSEKSKNEITTTLNAIKKLKKTTIVIFPNSDAGHQEIFNIIKNSTKKNPFLKVYPSVPRSDYLGLLQNCGVLVGNSSSGIIEGGYFKTSIVNIGLRQKDRERGTNVIDVTNSTPKILNAIKRGLILKKKNKFKNNFIYGRGTASKKIVRILEKVPLSKKLIQKQIQY